MTVLLSGNTPPRGTKISNSSSQGYRDDPLPPAFFPQTLHSGFGKMAPYIDHRHITNPVGHQLSLAECWLQAITINEFSTGYCTYPIKSATSRLQGL